MTDEKREKAIELLKAAMGNEGDMVLCFEINSYSGEIPQGNEAKCIELIRLAISLLQQPLCETCRGSGEVPDLAFGRFDKGRKKPCPTCKGTGKQPDKPEFGEDNAPEPYPDRQLSAGAFVKKCRDLYAKGANQEQWEFATLLNETRKIITDQAKTIAEQESEIERLQKDHDELDAMVQKQAEEIKRLADQMDYWRNAFKEMGGEIVDKSPHDPHDIKEQGTEP